MNYEEVYSRTTISLCNALNWSRACETEDMTLLFQLPLTVATVGIIRPKRPIRRPTKYYSSQGYKRKGGHRHMNMHPVSILLWASSCGVFIVAHKRKTEHKRHSEKKEYALADYTCQICTLRNEETIYHLFLKMQL